MMFKTQKSIFEIMASTNANWFIYYFKRIPVIGRILPDSIYRDSDLKKITAVVAAVLTILTKLIKQTIFFGLLLILPVMWLGKEFTPQLRYDSYIHVFFMLLFLGFLTSAIFSSERDKYICIRLMRMDAKSYIVSTILFHCQLNALCSLPVLVISSSLLGGTALQGLLLAVYAAGFDLIGEALHLFAYAKRGVILSKKVPFVVIAALLSLAAAYLPLWQGRPLDLNPLLFSSPCLLAFLALSGLCVYALVKSERYHEIAAATLKAADFLLDANDMMREALFSGVAIREKEFSASDLKSNKYENKRGYAFLNALFFERHRRLLIRPVLIRLGIIAVIFVAGVAALNLMPGFAEKLDGSSIDNALPGFVFVMYFASIGDQVCKAMFYNCDISLLRYSFYRNKQAVLLNFRMRLLRIAGLNIIIAAAISAAVVGLAVMAGGHWPPANMLFFVLSILFLSLFFSVHYLFLYYVFQPYTAELGMKNPFFGLINTAVYAVCFLCLQIKSAPSYFALIVLLSTFVYIAAALIIVYQYAPQTFRVK